MIKKFDEFINESLYDENDGWTTTSTQEIQRQLPRKEVLKLREQFKNISDCVTAIMNKDEKEIEKNLMGNRGMIVCSMPGAGLTHSIEDAVLKSNGTKNDLLTIPEDTKITESILYKYLYEYNNKLIVIEDFERILSDNRCRSMLKNALSNGKINAPLKIKIEDELPTQFTFNGYILLTSHKRIKVLLNIYDTLLDSIQYRCKLFNIFPDEEFKNTYIDRKRNY